MPQCAECKKPLKITGKRRVYTKEGRIETVCLECFYKRKQENRLYKPPQTATDIYKTMDKIFSKKTIQLILTIVLVVIVVYFGLIQFIQIGLLNWSAYIGSQSFIFLILGVVLILVAKGLLRGDVRFDPTGGKSPKQARQPQQKQRQTIEPPKQIKVDICDKCKKEFPLTSLEERDYKGGYILLCPTCLKVWQK